MILNLIIFVTFFFFLFKRNFKVLDLELILNWTFYCEYTVKSQLFTGDLISTLSWDSNLIPQNSMSTSKFSEFKDHQLVDTFL